MCATWGKLLVSSFSLSVSPIFTIAPNFKIASQLKTGFSSQHNTSKPPQERYSKVNLSLVQHKAKIIESKIHHLIYLNEMTRHDFIPALDGIITADICPGKSVKKDLLQYVDYLFISDEDIDGDLSEYAEATKGWVILHSSSGSIVTNGQEEFFYKMPDELMLTDVNAVSYTHLTLPTILLV